MHHDVELIDRESGASLGVCRVANAQDVDEAIAAAAAGVQAWMRLADPPLAGKVARASLQSPAPRWRVDADAGDFEVVRPDDHRPGGDDERGGDDEPCVEEIFDPRIDRLIEQQEAILEEIRRLVTTVDHANQWHKASHRALDACAENTRRAATRSIAWPVVGALLIFSILPGVVAVVVVAAMLVMGAAV